MEKPRTMYPPDVVELMRSVLDEAYALLPESKRTSAMKAEIASRILAKAAEGERNRTALVSSALEDLRTYVHDISPGRRAV